MRMILLASLLATHVAQAQQPTAIAVAITEGVTTQVKMPTEIKSAHGINISNHTDKPATFYWTVSLCPEELYRCVIVTDHLTLYPGQYWMHTYNLELTMAYQAVGSHSITAKTEITGAAYSVAYDTKYVDVHY